jgi:hypothetical protein
MPHPPSRKPRPTAEAPKRLDSKFEGGAGQSVPSPLVGRKSRRGWGRDRFMRCGWRPVVDEPGSREATLPHKPLHANDPGSERCSPLAPPDLIRAPAGMTGREWRRTNRLMQPWQRPAAELPWAAGWRDAGCGAAAAGRPCSSADRSRGGRARAACRRSGNRGAWARRWASDSRRTQGREGSCVSRLSRVTCSCASRRTPRRPSGARNVLLSVD